MLIILSASGKFVQNVLYYKITNAIYYFIACIFKLCHPAMHQIFYIYFFRSKEAILQDDASFFRASSSGKQRAVKRMT